MNRRSGGQTDGGAENGPEATVRPTVRPSGDLPREGRLIGIDWGERRIGLALTDPTQTLAQPLDTLSRRTGRRFPMRAFRNHVDTHHPSGVVMGLPLESDGSEGDPARSVRDVAREISAATHLPVAFVDERMTTSRVRRAVAELGGKVRGREAELDRLAATVVLQAFLDQRGR